MNYEKTRLYPVRYLWISVVVLLLPSAGVPSILPILPVTDLQGPSA